MKRVLFAAVHRLDRSPGQRFRFEQYLPYLRDNGWDVSFSSVVTARDDRFLNAAGHYPDKAALFARAAVKRLAEARRLDQYDVVFVQREALMAGPPFFERAAARSRARLVFDFDDAIWQDPAERRNALLGRLRNTGKTAEIIAASDLVFAGNDYLASYAREAADPARVRVVPTTIDTDVYVPDPAAARRDGPVCIGWSGSFSTVPYFEAATNALAEVKRRFGDRVTFKVVGDAQYRNERLGVAGTAWRADTELDDLGQMDVGIMPLPDDRWTQGKCGLKGLQYMALAIPTVMSPVGVNSDIIADGRNGLLASTDAEWVEALSWLVEDAELRRRLGAAGRETVVQDYSVRRWRDVYLGELDALAAQPTAR